MDRFLTQGFVHKVVLVVLTAAVWLRWDALANAEELFCSGQGGFAVKFKDEISPYRIMGVFVLPHEELALEAVGLDGSKQEQDYVLETPSGRVTQHGSNRWTWKAPSRADIYPVLIYNAGGDDTILLNVFVMVPFTNLKEGYLNGYQVGKYPEMPLKQLDIYKKPEGFVEVTEENENILVSPHFTLKQFLCKQNGGYPKYLVLRERLVIKLEIVLEKLNEAGYHCNSFHVMSGYRTPCYNECIGNVKYSRHVWGGAADIFVDEDQNGMMDDLNKDGKIDFRDAHIIYKIVDRMFGESWYIPFMGGLGRYSRGNNHGPFVHIDVRGFRTRWGT